MIDHKKKWLITGVAGFIGTNLLIKLLKENQSVVGVDNFYSGSSKNLKQVKKIVGKDLWSNFSFIEGDICDYGLCKNATKDIDYVLHHAAMGSVPKSMEYPLLNNKINVEGFLNILNASKENKVKRIIYASSSAVYGDDTNLPKTEKSNIKPLSPYALSKVINENYSNLFSKIYRMDIVGLRYFNVYGSFQNVNGDYAAVIPKWIESFIRNEKVFINGDGKNTRDFCHVSDVVNSNILIALSEEEVMGKVFNIGSGIKISLKELYTVIKESMTDLGFKITQDKPLHKDFRKGDIIDSYASIEQIKKVISYKSRVTFKEGLKETISWFANKN
tara:strand:+ start:4333 stop:5325 length:993 start_codon:yes stop_codon:yes gene_type:complete